MNKYKPSTAGLCPLLEKAGVSISNSKMGEEICLDCSFSICYYDLTAEDRAKFRLINKIPLSLSRRGGIA